MKQIFKILAVICFTLVFVNSVSAQRKSRVEDALNDKSPYTNLHVGSYVAFGYSNGWILDFSPSVGYKFFDFLIVEGGLNYAYGEQFTSNTTNSKQTTTLIGPKFGVKGNIFQQFYGIGEYQYLWFKAKEKGGNGNVSYTYPTTKENIFFIGGGYASSFGEGFSVYTDFMIDVLYQRLNSPRLSPYTFRFGVFYTFP